MKISHIPLPQHEKKRLIQAEINQDLFEAIEFVAKRRKLKMREVLEWGLKQFLVAANPEKAAQLGIIEKEQI